LDLDLAKINSRLPPGSGCRGCGENTLSCSLVMAYCCGTTGRVVTDLPPLWKRIMPNNSHTSFDNPTTSNAVVQSSDTRTITRSSGRANDINITTTAAGAAAAKTIIIRNAAAANTPGRVNDNTSCTRRDDLPANKISEVEVAAAGDGGDDGDGGGFSGDSDGGVTSAREGAQNSTLDAPATTTEGIITINNNNNNDNSTAATVSPSGSNGEDGGSGGWKGTPPTDAVVTCDLAAKGPNATRPANTA
ncbi:hypothetical protein Vafri_13649, partial [Volvox africanus]